MCALIIPVAKLLKAVVPVRVSQGTLVPSYPDKEQSMTLIWTEHNKELNVCTDVGYLAPTLKPGVGEGLVVGLPTTGPLAAAKSVMSYMGLPSWAHLLQEGLYGWVHGAMGGRGPWPSKPAPHKQALGAVVSFPACVLSY